MAVALFADASRTAEKTASGDDDVGHDDGSCLKDNAVEDPKDGRAGLYEPHRLGFLTKYDAAKTAVAAHPSQAFINALQSMESIQLLERKSALRRHEFSNCGVQKLLACRLGAGAKCRSGTAGSAPISTA